MKRVKGRKRKNILIGILLTILLIMTIGYSAFSSKFDIKGSSMITSKWDIEITDLKVKNTLGYVEDISHSFDTLTTNMNASFKAPGDEITYEVTVSNLGSLDATLDNIKINMDSQDVIQFKVDGIMSGDVLKQGESTKFDVIMKYNEDITSPPDLENVTFGMNLNYLQNGNSSNFSDADSDTSDILAINGIDLDISETSIKANISANNAFKYYYSLDNDKWYETTENMYTIYHLKPYTDYVMYIKAEDTSGEVVFSSKAFKTLDNTNPELELTLGNNTKGNNGWYKGIDINIIAKDNGNIALSKYCISSDETCTPNIDLALTEGKGTYQFASSKDAQTLCVLVKDEKGNETTKCTNSYKVDSEVPTITNITVTPNEATMTIVLDVNDNHSGVYKYYYSKDNGQNYIKSDSPNYTFMNLAGGNYLVTAYIEDQTGNISEVKAQSTNIAFTSFCTQYGLSNLSDCIIASEANEGNVETAKQKIEAKGTPDFNVTSPSTIYREVHDVNTSTKIEDSYLKLANSYTFNESTGYYTLNNPNLVNPETIDFTDGKNYYMIVSDNYSSTSGATMYKVVDMSVSTNSSTGAKTYTLTKYNYTSSIKSYDNSSTGMYATQDDDGTSYYYRGAVAGNYVKLADKYWRIIRVNGDGTLRLIYDGTSLHLNGESSSDRQIGTKSFNVLASDNAYIGYMYGDTNNNQIEESNGSYIQPGLNSTIKYYFGTDYIFDKNTNTFKLAGDLVQATITEYGEQYNDEEYYTCFNANSNATCEKLWHAQKYNSPTAMEVKVVTYASTSYEKAHANEVNSNIKVYLENWYKNNMMNVDNLISKDTIFCNNRKVYDSGNGYGLFDTIYSNQKIIDSNPDLYCPQNNDKFSVTTTKGNGKMNNPVGLITADEVSMAGGITGAQNTLYYLYTGTNYWTMTPAHYYYYDLAHEFYVVSTGGIGTWNMLHSEFGVRPVINLDTTKVTFTGTGTMQDPYVIK